MQFLPNSKLERFIIIIPQISNATAAICLNNLFILSMLLSFLLLTSPLYSLIRLDSLVCSCIVITPKIMYITFYFVCRSIMRIIFFKKFIKNFGTF